MHEAARTRYATLDRIGDAHINAALLAQLDKKIASGTVSYTHLTLPTKA